MRLRPATLALLLLAAAAGAAGQGGAPLEASKKALQELQADQAVKPGAKTGDGIKAEDLPQLHTPSPELAAPGPAPRDNRRERDKDPRKKGTQANWLLDGVDKLGREPRDRNQAGRDSRKDLPEEEEKPDSSDPDYVLQLYAQQKKEAEAKAEVRQAAKARPDPIAPFLQDWLGNSPVRGKFFDEYVWKSDPGSGSVPAAGPAEAGANQLPDHALTRAGRQTAAPTAPQPNPYLAGLESPATPETASRGLEALSAGAPGIGPGPARGPVTEPNPAPRAAEKKPPLLAPSDNEKYFPQQKKF